MFSARGRTRSRAIALRVIFALSHASQTAGAGVESSTIPFASPFVTTARATSWRFLGSGRSEILARVCDAVQPVDHRDVRDHFARRVRDATAALVESCGCARSRCAADGYEGRAHRRGMEDIAEEDAGGFALPVWDGDVQ
ncbi:hypothetical protein C2E23DRAFT_832944 [Lenzites betulinus]|nr:hypothetical protein C2E23DRAFT_832944 [Lenzites betulinus]